MALELNVNIPDYEKGLEMEVAGVLVKNGATTKLSESDEQTIVARTGKSVKDAFAGSETVKVSGTAAVPPSKVEGETS